MADVPVTRESRNRGITRGESSQWALRPRDLFSLNPFDMMRRFTDEMDRWFGDVGRPGGQAQMWSPRVEVMEKDNQLHVSADLPGLKKEDVKLEVNEDGLVIQGERKSQHEERGGDVYRCEREYGHFYRLIPLPQDVETDKIKAQFNNGVLEVTVPIPESSRRRREIPIEAESKTRTSGGGV